MACCQTKRNNSNNNSHQHQHQHPATTTTTTKAVDSPNLHYNRLQSNCLTILQQTISVESSQQSLTTGKQSGLSLKSFISLRNELDARPGVYCAPELLNPVCLQLLMKTPHGTLAITKFHCKNNGGNNPFQRWEMHKQKSHSKRFQIKGRMFWK